MAYNISLETVADYVANVKAEYKRQTGRPFITAPLGKARHVAEDLAMLTGMTAKQAASLADAQLVTLYSVAASRRPWNLVKIANKLLGDIGQSILEPNIIVSNNVPDSPSAAPMPDAPIVATVEPIPAPAMPAPPANPFPPVDGKHAMYPRVLAMLKKGIWPYLIGHAGTGKTTLAKQLAEALGVPFYCQSSVENASDLLGFLDMRGNATPTPFKECFLNGGLFLLDEMDNSESAALTSFNAAIANLMAMFPDGMKSAASNVYFIGAGNTNGDGSCMIYNRAKLDFATRDRFKFIKVDYDPAIETTMAGGNTGWLEYCRAIREAAFNLPVRGMVAGGPRDIKGGADMLEVGFTAQEAADACFFNKMTKTDAERLQEQVRIAAYL